MTTEGELRPRRVDMPMQTILELLSTTALFTGGDRATIMKIAPHVFPVEVPAGMVIVRAGQRCRRIAPPPDARGSQGC